MDFIKTESTIPAMLSSDNFSKFPHDEALNENLPTLIKVKQETFDPDDKFYNLINPSTLANHQIENTMNIKTEATNVLSLVHNNIGLSTETLSSTMSDAKDSLGLNLNQLSTSIIKYESIDIKVESYDEFDATPIISDLESSLISIKDESYEKLVNLIENKCLAQSSNNFCNICGKNFVNIHTFNRHYTEVHEKNTKYLCKICNKTFVRKAHLKNHENAVHLKIRAWKCNICEKSFAKEGNLKVHRRVHISDFCEVCDICNKPFRYLEYHKRNMHPKCSAKYFKCTHCDKVFLIEHNLKRHMIVHSNVRDWKCKICDKSFKRKSNLQRHERIHSNKSSDTC